MPSAAATLNAVWDCSLRVPRVIGAARVPGPTTGRHCGIVVAATGNTLLMDASHGVEEVPIRVNSLLPEETSHGNQALRRKFVVLDHRK